MWSKTIIIQSLLLHGRSEETAQVEEEMDGHGGGLVYLLCVCVCVQGDMMDVCGSCVTLGVVWVAGA